MAGNPLTTNVAIFWVGGTKPGAPHADSSGRTSSPVTAEKWTTDDWKAHWEHIYKSKIPTEVSWFQEHAPQSLNWIVRLGVAPDAPIIDVGGGTSPLAADLLAANFTNITVLDVSGAAISRAQMRLGTQAARITWLEADITTVELPAGYYAIWHDRAVFHFLTVAQKRQQYIQRATAALKPGGHVIIATFAPDGPTQCSGLVTARYSPEALQLEFGESFTLVQTMHEAHTTPFGTQQQFIYCHFKKRE